MQSIKDFGNQISEKVQKTGSTASKEANKSVAKDSNVPISTRASAAKNALGDKMDESRHGTKEELYKAKK